MPPKKKAAAPATEATEDPKKAKKAAKRAAAEAGWATYAAERESTAAKLAADQAALIEQRKKVKADPDGNIDQRMASLQKDHEAMGAR